VKKVLYTAAHSGFNLGQVPLGGGASVCQHLVQEWSRQKPFEFDVLGPSILKESAPQHKDLVHYSEWEYARFCRRFERQLTDRILQYDPQEVIVLSNDISEGPDFKTLAAKGYSVYTIYHVDVVDYFTTIYLRGWVKPETATRLYQWVEKLCHSRGRRRESIKQHDGSPTGAFGDDIWSIIGLVFRKQEDSVRCSKGLIVPSHRMKEVLLRCYPELAPSRVHVLPWGVWEDPVSPQEVQREKEALQKEYLIPSGSWTLITLSRISPEKGQDRLLKALALWEKQVDFPKEGLCLFIAGESAYMMGKKYLKTLQDLAAKLKRSQVHFVGYASGARKQALFELSDLYVFPSRHESYGLTLLEALSAGKPVLATPSHGAQEVFKPGFGEMVPPSSESLVPEHLMNGLRGLLSDRSKLSDMGKAASKWAAGQNFSDTAARLAQLLKLA
jgi:glycosyltransferase involved in cell wall biosynthesis